MALTTLIFFLHKLQKFSHVSDKSDDKLRASFLNLGRVKINIKPNNPPSLGSKHKKIHYSTEHLRTNTQPTFWNNNPLDQISNQTPIHSAPNSRSRID